MAKRKRSSRHNSRPRGRPTVIATLERSADILRAAAELFERRSFAGVAMADVARLARVSRTTLYARFPDKMSLFRAISSYSCRQPADRLRAVETGDRDPHAVLADFARTIVASSENDEAERFLRLVIFEAPRHPEVAAQILAESRLITAPLHDYLLRLAGDGRLNNRDPSSLADQFVALVTGGYMGLLDTGSAEIRERRVSAALSLIFNGGGLSGATHDG